MTVTSTAAGTVDGADATDIAGLGHHGDRDLAAGATDLAVNVRPGTPPSWLRDALAAVDLAAYPDDAAARAVIAAHHGRAPDEVLITAGAAEAFVLIARALRPEHATVVHPQFTEPELALRAAGHDVDRVVLAAPFVLDPAAVPAGADLVVIGNPTNPTSVLHPRATLATLARPGRILVVDEAFADTVPGQRESVAAGPGLPGVVVVRSLTKTWGLAGLRVGYVLAEPTVVAALAAAQPHWAVSAPALRACELCLTPAATAVATRWATELVEIRDEFVDRLAAIPGVVVVPDQRASFVLITAADGTRDRLLRRGFAVRRGETFPGLDARYLRVAVRDRHTCSEFVAALEAAQREAGSGGAV